MKPNFALDLSHEGINLLHRSKGGWTLVASVGLDDPDIGARLSEMRRSAAMLESGGFTTKLIIPDSQVLYTTVAAPGPDDIAREVQIRAALDGMTPYPVGELVFDWRAQGDEARVAVLARETMDEAEAFAADHQFNPVSFVGRPKRGEFSGEPFFGKTRAAARLLPPGERIEPDASPVPANSKAKELPVEARIDLPPDPEPPIEPDTAPPPPDLYDDPFAELDRLASELSGDAPVDADDGDKPAPEAPKRPKRKTERLSPVSPPALAPFPPTPDEEGDAPMPTPRPFMPKRDATAKASRPAPKQNLEPKRPAIPAAPPPVTPPVDELDTLDKPDSVPSAPERSTPADPPQETPANAPQETESWPISFASTRAAIPPAPGAHHSDGADADTSGTPAPTPKAPPPLRDPGVPPLPHGRVRADMADALSKPLPRSGAPAAPEPARESRPGIFTALGKRASATVGSAGNALNARAAARRDAKAAKPARAEKPQAPAPKADLDTRADTRKGSFGFKRPQGTTEDKRTREAEALTVFGARRSQTQSSRPRYLGVILTLVLLLVMAAVAIWSTFLVEDGEVSLFNPSPDIATQNTDPAPDVDTAADETGESPAPGTAEVLSREAAETRYAATGIWQRAPDAPSTPETTRLDQLDIAALAPISSNREPTALPEDRANGEREALLANPVPPPPPGTAFDLDENGLVVPTPEGALSPTGILVFSGSPAATPPQPPDGLFPDTAATEPVAPDDAAVEGTIADDATIEDAIAAVAGEVAQPDVAAVRPAARPEDLVVAAAATVDDGAAPAPGIPAPEPDTAAIDAAVEDVVQASLVNATELAVAASRVPNQRPANFASIVETTLASGSDGSQVIAASATVTPAIPTSASVATRATTENALNLREINLIGIYGSSNARRALIRLKTGRYVKVEVGDKLDGGKVTSISASRLTYQKGSRTYALDVLPLG